MGIQIFALPRPRQQRDFCMLPIKCALNLVSCGVLRYNRASVVRVLSVRPYKLTQRTRERERCIEGHNRIHTHTHSRAVSAEDQFFFLARSRTQHHQSCRYFSFTFFLSPSDPIHAAHSVSPRALTALICEAFKGALAGWLAGWLTDRLSERLGGLALCACQARISLMPPAQICTTRARSL
jgi:hypothetical protein